MSDQKLNKNQAQAMEYVKSGVVFFFANAKYSGYVRKVKDGHYIDIHTRTMRSLMLRGLCKTDTLKTFEQGGNVFTPVVMM